MATIYRVELAPILFDVGIEEEDAIKEATDFIDSPLPERYVQIDFEPNNDDDRKTLEQFKNNVSLKIFGALKELAHNGETLVIETEV